MKKGLAIVLAAATAFTFAPVASLSSAVSAYAANPQITTSSINLTVDKTTTYALDKPAGAADDASVSIQSDKVSVAEASVGTANKTTADNTDIATGTAWNDIATNGISVKGKTVGTAHITVKYTNQLTNPVTIVLTVNVKAKSALPASINAGDSKNTAVALGGTITVRKASENGAAVTLADAEDTAKFNVGTVTTSNDKVVSVSGNKLTYAGVGTATITVPYTVDSSNRGTSGNAKDGTTSFTVTVLPANSTFKIGSKTISDTTTYDANSDAAHIASVVYLTGTNPTKNIGATLADPMPGEKLEYTAYTSTSAIVTSTTETKDITVSDNGDVTATANAFEQADKVYFVKVSIKNDATKSAYVKVVTSRNEKAFSSLTVNAEGKDYKAESSYKADGTYNDASNSDAKVALSTADKKTVTLNVTSNSTNGFTVKSSDENTVATSVSGNTVTLTALKLGPATVTIANKADTTHYGSATVTLNVTVTTQLLNAKVVAEKSAVTLTKLTKSADLKASVVTTPALAKQPTLKYQFVTKDKDGNYVKAGSTDLTLSDKGTVTYNTTNEGTAIVEIYADATDTYAKPASAYVTVTYTQKQLPTKLSVSTKSLNLEEGASDAIAATGTALSFKSSDEKVATVDATGKVTGVKEGVAVITVSDAGNDEFAAGSADVTVYVTAKAVKPAKVTGVKVSNKKGAKVSVSWTSQDKNINYRVYKKVGSGKWVAKNVTSNKATLSVKKGAKVTVKVKAFVKGTDGKTVWGPKATSKSFKTDKK
ncbi:MAG: hypothetical protein PUF90_02610 [Lachnospiraceae bacterium]|nr:hypothetical protein [Lachnospiraceae bacterium]